MNRFFIGALAAALWTPAMSPSDIDLRRPPLSLAHRGSRSSTR
jgi:hypothetical protein